MARKKQPAEKKPTKPKPVDVKEPVVAEEPESPEPEAVVPGTQEPVGPVDKPTEAAPAAPVVAEAPEADAPDVPETQEAEPDPSPIPAQPFVPSVRDPRLPEVGSVITRQYKGTVIEVTVLADGFEFNGETYSSISKVAAAVSGAKAVNGFAFFKLGTIPGGKSRSGAGTAARLAARINKIESLVVRLKTAVEAGQTALAEAEAEIERTKEDSVQGEA